MLQRFHSSEWGAHLAAGRTRFRLESQFFMPKMRSHVDEFVFSCLTCKMRRLPETHNVPQGTIQATRPNQLWVIDVNKGFPYSHDGFTMMLTCVDAFTGMMFADPIPDEQAGTVVNHIQRIIGWAGAPESILTDNGPCFISQAFKEACSKRGTQVIHSSSRHPQGHSPVERMNRTLNALVTKLCRLDQTRWTSHLRSALLAYNTSLNSSTGFTPYFLFHGRDLRTPTATLLTGASDQVLDTYEDFAMQLHSDLSQALSQAVQRRSKTQQRVSLKNKTAITRPVFDVGDRVFLFNTDEQVTSVDGTKKTRDLWTGPYPVVEVPHGSLTNCIIEMGRGRRIMVHVDRLSKDQTTHS
jgi:transposase InsO family protein